MQSVARAAARMLAPSAELQYMPCALCMPATPNPSPSPAHAPSRHLHTKAPPPCTIARAQSTRSPSPCRMQALASAHLHTRAPALQHPAREEPAAAGSTPASAHTPTPPKDLPTDRGPWKKYQEGLDEGKIRFDERQLAVMELLQRLYLKLEVLYPRKSKRSNLTMVEKVDSTQPWWKSVLGAASSSSADDGATEDDRKRVYGLYMWGGVGVGKTMLMDLLVAAAPSHMRLLRTHYHDFMLDVHKSLRQFSGEQDPLRKVGDAIAARTRVLCLDEFFVTDVADAAILNRLFTRLFDDGVVLVATSNRRPDKLYEGGLQRALFVPFIHRLEKECHVHDMDSPTDYRQLATRTVGVYFVRLVEGRTNDDRVSDALRRILHGESLKPTVVEVAMGREIKVENAAEKMCLFTFDELCGANVGASDYIALCNRFHTIALKKVPTIDASNRHKAYRFVTLIDVMYEHRTKLLISADKYANQLFDNIVTVSQSKEMSCVPESMVVDDNLGFAKDRTMSRLTEMQTIEYAISHAERHAPELLYALQDAQAKQRNTVVPSKR